MFCFRFYLINRFGSSSSQASQNSGDICRICHCESDPQNPLLTPCYCSGSLKYVHQTCLQQWLTASETNSCELCKFPFIMHTKIKPFNEVSVEIAYMTTYVYVYIWTTCVGFFFRFVFFSRVFFPLCICYQSNRLD